MNRLEIKHLKDLKQISFNLAMDLTAPQIVLLRGELAIGKTQMVQYMTQALGFDKGLVNSPTFSIINVYKKNTNSFIYHVDLYRVKREEELDDIAFWDLFYEPSIVFIEWPQIVEKNLPPLWNKLFIQISYSKKGNSRILKWSQTA